MPYSEEYIMTFTYNVTDINDRKIVQYIVTLITNVPDFPIITQPYNVMGNCGPGWLNELGSCIT
jgi:hypothetical protein